MSSLFEKACVVMTCQLAKNEKKTYFLLKIIAIICHKFPSQCKFLFCYNSQKQTGQKNLYFKTHTNFATASLFSTVTKRHIGTIIINMLCSVTIEQILITKNHEQK